MSDERPETRETKETQGTEGERSPVTAGGALGGLLLIVAFFSPIYEIGGSPGENDVAARAIEEFERTLAEARVALADAPPEYAGFVEKIEPATEHAAAFLQTPSPKNLAWLAADARELAEVALIADPSREEEIGLARGMFGALLFVLLSIPAVGAYHLIRGVATRCRKHGSVGLALSFFAGVAYLGIGAGSILAVPEASRGQLGLAAGLLAVGGLLLVVTGIFGVSRKTWWKAYLLEVFGLIAIVYAAVTLASERL